MWWQARVFHLVSACACFTPYWYTININREITQQSRYVHGLYVDIYIYMLLLFSHSLITTTQSVVTGQAPITLERKNTSGGKQIKTEDNTHNN